MNEDSTHRQIVLEYLKYFEKSEQFEDRVSLGTLKAALRALTRIEHLVKHRKKEMRAKYAPKKKFRVNSLLRDQISPNGKTYGELTETTRKLVSYEEVVAQGMPPKKPRKYIPPKSKPSTDDDKNQN